MYVASPLHVASERMERTMAYHDKPPSHHQSVQRQRIPPENQPTDSVCEEHPLAIPNTMGICSFDLVQKEKEGINGS
jgi:hypothetical protein